MKNLKKLVLLMMGTLLIACGVACSNPNEQNSNNTEKQFEEYYKLLIDKTKN